jgi:AraC family transcriptional regulator
MEAKIVTKPTFKAVGMKYHGKNEHGEIPQLWARFMPYQGEIKVQAQPGIFLGIVDYYDEASGEFDYIAGMEVKQNGFPPADMVSVTVPAQTYAVFKCTLPSLHETYHSIYHTWLPASKYHRAAGPEFELYDEDFARDETMYVYIPIEPGEI